MFKLAYKKTIIDFLTDLERILSLEKMAIEEKHLYSILRIERLKNKYINILADFFEDKYFDREDKEKIIYLLKNIIEKNKNNLDIVLNSKKLICSEIWKMKKISKFIQ
ncbi:MAG: hypothetical protein N2446_01955 [Elusimicrobiales bacterium]|nr:hypothetical protein [Elusimicrobiales bacterium]